MLVISEHSEDKGRTELVAIHSKISFESILN